MRPCHVMSSIIHSHHCWDASPHHHITTSITYLYVVTSSVNRPSIELYITHRLSFLLSSFFLIRIIHSFTIQCTQVDIIDDDDDKKDVER